LKLACRAAGESVTGSTFTILTTLSHVSATRPKCVNWGQLQTTEPCWDHASSNPHPSAELCTDSHQTDTVRDGTGRSLLLRH
jgi:hypothetical protein